MNAFTADKDALYFVPLGGSEQFGVNLNVYISKGKMLAVDCGLGFADERFPGIDLMLPDPAFLEARRERLQGLVITHAHEDHIGAVAPLWDRLECPVYCSAFTAAVLDQKFRERGLKHVDVHVVDPGDTVKIGAFRVRFVPVSHSIPGTCSLVIETEQGRVLHSGDWNLDPKPVLGRSTDPKPFKEAGDEGVLAYIGDSTNAEHDGWSGSESDVEKGLTKEFAAHQGRIAVTIFSSNIGRIRSIARAAQKNGRDVVVVGRSLHRMIGAARECGYLGDVPDFVSEEDAGYLPEDKVVMIVTGSQGEYRAALAKIARGEHPGVRLHKGDSVIFSARAIPGNDRNINAVKNNLSAAGITIITPRDTKNVIHVSGHPYRDEIAQMYQWVRPQIVVPVHGERVQLEAQGQFARECQIPHVLVPNNGSVIRLAPGEPAIVDHVETGLLAVDQKRIIPADHRSITARRKLQYTGAVHVSVALDVRGEILGEPRVDSVGLIDPDDEEEKDFEQAMQDEILDIWDDLSREERLDDHFVSEELRIGMRRFCQHFLGLRPKTTVHVIRV